MVPRQQSVQALCHEQRFRLIESSFKVIEERGNFLVYLGCTLSNACLTACGGQQISIAALEDLSEFTDKRGHTPGPPGHWMFEWVC